MHMMAGMISKPMMAGMISKHMMAGMISQHLLHVHLMLGVLNFVYAVVGIYYYIIGIQLESKDQR